MEIRRNIVPPQAHNVGNQTNQPKTGEVEELLGTTVQPVDAEVLFAQGDNNTENTNGNNGTNNNGNSGNNGNNGTNNSGGGHKKNFKIDWDKVRNLIEYWTMMEEEMRRTLEEDVGRRY